jgi:hypothetical protein
MLCKKQKLYQKSIDFPNTNISKTCSTNEISLRAETGSEND